MLVVVVLVLVLVLVVVVVVVIYFYSLTTIQYENKTNKKIITKKSYNINILQNKLKE